ncbi:hypothetical protein [Pseudorhodoferax sp. Leaf267]|uniref:hypothetical protein n=1 Tax=Pseudorhodoferax sp. Leaf267 TaxID=1736316 RepID=UPI0006F6EE2A|nr:hypothetical protein [Pseudorhodoferax sp. Leaf267]KQP12789.1 hypothetical protein ASF43_21505 [Pseudorhodoferax sp. Leaf267]
MQRFFQDGWAALVCVVAAVSATLLSGMNFPEQNNLWHLPVVLNYPATQEGPHDPYHATFTNFISVFWLVVRQFATEQNVQTVFYGLQLGGNALLALTLYGFARIAQASRRATLLVCMGLPFCYGLWGATRLGFSELFVTYATHTQYAIVLCLLGLLLLLHGRVLLSALAVGAAANTNLFMAAWTFATALLFIAAVQKKPLARDTVRYAAVFLVAATPTLLWLHSIPRGPALPMAFFQEFLRGHVYALDYPRAALQTVLLGATAGMALWRHAPGSPGLVQLLGLLNLCCTAVLVLAMAAPYVCELPAIGLLHPLRFASITVLLSAACAAVLLLQSLATGGAGAMLPALAAVAGFLIKEPLVSILGLALAAQGGRPARPWRAAMLAALASLLLDAPTAALSAKLAVFCSLLAALLAAAWLADGAGPRGAAAAASLAVAGVLTLLDTTVWTVVATLALMACLMLAAPRWQVAALAAALLAALAGVRQQGTDGPTAALLVAALLLVPAAALAARQLGSSGRGAMRLAGAGRLCIVAPLLLALPAGYARFALEHARAPTKRADALTDAASWARQHTPVGASFFLDVPDNGFANQARRAVWWLPSQGAAAMWSTAFHATWVCRRDAAAAFAARGETLQLVQRAHVDYVVTSAPQPLPEAQFALVHASGPLRVYRLLPAARQQPELCAAVAAAP